MLTSPQLENMDGFPMQPNVLHGRNCFLEDLEAGLAPREAIERNKPYEPPDTPPLPTEPEKHSSG